MTLFLIDAVIKATLLLAVAAATAAMLRRSSAASRHLVWTIALLAALMLPVLSVALPRWQVPVVTVGPTAVAAGESIDAASRDMAARMFNRLQASTPTSGAAATTPNERPATMAFSWGAVAVVIWLVGAALILGRLLLGLVAVQVLARRSVHASGAAWLPLAQQLARDLHVTNVTFRRSRQASMPMAWGLWRASVTLPEDADSWSEDRLRIVLLHELAHVKRRDCLTHVLAQVACAFYWFNPLAWVAARHVRAERERACDDLVLAAGTPGADYADQLLTIARVMRAGRFSSVVAGASLAMAQPSQLEGRLMAILDPSVPRTGVSPVRRLAAVALAVLTLVPLASLQAWSYDVQNPPAPVPAPIATPAPAPTPVPSPVVVSGVQGGVRGGVRGGVPGGVRADVQGAVQGGVQGAVQGAIQGSIQGALQGTVQGAVQGALQGAVQGPWVDAKVTTSDWQDAKQAKAKADPKVIAALTAALKDTDKDVRETALHALVQLRDPGIFEPLLAALKDGSPDMREQAAFGLGQMKDKRAVDPLMAAMKDADDSVREQVVFALGQLRDPRATEGLIAALKDTHANVREQAAFALGQLRAANAVEALVVALKDNNASVREQAAFALGQIRDPRAIDGLTTALKDSSASVRHQAAFALGQLAK
jgi:HEAT repeat protein/beta-lactamase regulating signal transducer with metallopeptidase domain